MIREIKQDFVVHKHILPRGVEINSEVFNSVQSLKLSTVTVFFLIPKKK